MNTLQTIILTLVTLVAFAANSILCRLELSTEQVHPADFTGVGLLSAALTLTLIIAFKNTAKLREISEFGIHLSAIYLFIYAAVFPMPM